MNWLVNSCEEFVGEKMTKNPYQYNNPVVDAAEKACKIDAKHGGEGQCCKS